MLILPIGRDDAEVRRTPWISWTIIALNFLVYLGMFGVMQSTERKLEPIAVEAVRYLVDHPYLEIPAALEQCLSADMVEHFRQIRAQSSRPPALVIEREQSELERLSRGLAVVIEDSPLFRWGYIPSKASVLTLLTSMFLHAGLFHLLGNMLFFFLSGPFVEDVYGRAIFPVLYFCGGAIATVSWAALHHDAAVPLVGASGAIAAVMGVYFVRFFKSKIELLWLPFGLPIVRHRFFMPAFVVLPLWFAEQAVLATYETETSGVAFSAHVSGFLFGVLFGTAMRLTKIEERFVNPGIEAQTSWKESAEYVRALEARDCGDLVTARRSIDIALRRDPQNTNALSLAAEIGWSMEDWSYASRQSIRCLEEHVKRREEDLARDLINGVARDWYDQADARFFARAASCVESWGDARFATELRAKAAARDPEGTIAIPALIRIAKDLRSRGDEHGARAALEKARALPAMNESWRNTIDIQLAEMSDSPWAPS